MMEPRNSTTPRLSVTESGTWDDQYLPTHAGSRTMGLLMRRSLDNQKSKLAKNTPQERFSKAQVAYEGNLVKQGSFWRTWRKRWFILRSDRPLLCYYKSKDDLELLGELVIDATTTVELVASASGHFCIKTTGRKLMLSAHDDGGVPYMNRWVAAIREAIRLCISVEPAPFKSIDDVLHVEVKHVPLVGGISHQQRSSSPVFIHRVKSHSAENGIMRRTNSLRAGNSAELDDRELRTISSSKLLTSMVATSWTNRNEREDSATSLSSLSLVHVLPPPAFHFAISLGCKQEPLQGMLVVALSVLEWSHNTNLGTELARTEVEYTQSVRQWGDRWVRDFQALLALPISLVQANVVLQFDVYGVTTPASEGLKNQTPLGYFTIASQDLMADSDDGTPLLLDLHPRDQDRVYFLVVEQVATRSALHMDHLYHFASQYYLVDTVSSDGNTAATTRSAAQVLVTEEMGATLSSLSVTVAFIRMLRRRNRLRMESARLAMEEIESRDVNRSSITSPTAGFALTPQDRPSVLVERSMSWRSSTNIDASSYAGYKARLEECEEVDVKYIQAERVYAALLLMTREGEEHGITGCLKRSTMKKDEMMAFMPTNLVCHTLRAAGGPTAPDRIWSVVTHGCSAAHIHGFKEGGLRKKKHHEHRTDIVVCQLLSIVAASFLSSVHLATDGNWDNGGEYALQLAIAAEIGYLVDIESLLSTMGNEKGMLEDMSEGVHWLNRHVYLRVASSTTAIAMECTSIELEGEDDIVMEFTMPEALFESLPLEWQRPARRVKLTAVLFTQGINEVQSVANTVGGTSLQDEINRESLGTLMEYVGRYIQFLDDATVADIDQHLAALHSAIDNQSNKKQVNILIESSDLCRRLGAGRTICCKSGKDRTAMSVTLEFSRILVDQMGVKQGMHLCQTMRERGVRRTNVLVNTGKTMYAFNSIQLKCLPSCYQPPPHTANANVTS
ncbi:unnamed protein product [Aphanomyces euteiches]